MSNPIFLYIACLIAAYFAQSLLRGRLLPPLRDSFPRGFLFLFRPSVFLALFCLLTVPGFAAPIQATQPLANTPPMGWNDWAHYQCGFTAKTILTNARALVKTGLAARGYNTVTIDDCWMQKDRDANGNLQADPQRFPQGMKEVAEAVHALGLKFGIYEDAGYATCGGFAGSGEPKGGGKDHFLQDARLFASWGVDYLKLDGCNVYVPKGENMEAAYRAAYAAQSAALEKTGRPIVFSESAPAYFLDSPEWYNVLSWVRRYGQLWREGWDIANYQPNKPDASRFHAVLWNYAYNLPLGRFQKPGNWDDPDFIIGGDRDFTMAETRSQVALWSMMSAPLILSSDVEALSSQTIAILGNKNVIAIDQDPVGRMATLVRRSSNQDILFKKLAGGDYAIAVLNRGTDSIPMDLHPRDFGFAATPECRLDVWNLWSDTHQLALAALKAQIAPHDTAIWRIHPASVCGAPTRTGAIIMTTIKSRREIDSYSRCLAAPGSVGPCAGIPAETWTITASGGLESGGRCLDAANGKVAMQLCGSAKSQRWHYTLAGNLINEVSNKCLGTIAIPNNPQSLSIQNCGNNLPNQIWSLPN